MNYLNATGLDSPRWLALTARRQARKKGDAVLRQQQVCSRLPTCNA